MAGKPVENRAQVSAPTRVSTATRRRTEFNLIVTEVKVVSSVSASSGKSRGSERLAIQPNNLLGISLSSCRQTKTQQQNKMTAALQATHGLTEVPGLQAGHVTFLRDRVLYCRTSELWPLAWSFA